uniref:Galactosylgalactosylxylosylprotein 3-beta-glucuronosyltransferase n=1 Tax=Meloidogyne hapla TaxID=6305 RepID=A0A1I8BVR9_MELHA
MIPSNSFLQFSSYKSRPFCVLLRKLLRIIILIICILFILIFIIYFSGYQNFQGLNRFGSNQTLNHKSHINANDQETIDQSEETFIFIITPTYKRLERLAEMTRLSQTLMHVENIKWIVVEDGYKTVPAVESILKRSGIPYIYIATTTKTGFPTRGWCQRNEALKYLRKNYANYENNAVVYFADDDNTYDIRLFDNYIRQVETIGVWAVGLVGTALVEAPHVEHGLITSWDILVLKHRKFGVDMAGFAVNLQLILRTNAAFHRYCRNFAPENCFLVQLGIPLEMVRPFGWNDQPKELLVWHTKSIKDYPRNGSSHGYVTEAKNDEDYNSKNSENQ